MGGIIDFSTDCPWELYLFAFAHLGGAIVMYFVDSCRLLTSTSCTDAEKIFESLAVLSLLYVGVIFTVLTFHNKSSAAKVTRLSNIALNGAVALLASVVFAGNSSFDGGIERSWMHMGDMLTAIILVGVLCARVAKADAEWAQKKPLNEGMGINCKTLLILFGIVTVIKFVAYTDFIDPKNFLPDDSEMTDFAVWMWKFMVILILEIFLAVLFSVLFDDDAGHELVVFTIIIMSVIAALLINPVQKYMSDWMGLNSNVMWIRLGVLILVCIVAIVGGRQNPNRAGYQSV